MIVIFIQGQVKFSSVMNFPPENIYLSRRINPFVTVQNYGNTQRQLQTKFVKKLKNR